MNPAARDDGEGEPERPARAAWVYIVECADGTYYTGWSFDVTARVAAHNAGRGARYTRGRTPVRLRWVERHERKEAAMQREWRVKRLPRRCKEQLIAGEGEVRGRGL